MRHFLFGIFSILSLSACAVTAPCSDPPSMKLVKQPETVFEFFKGSVRCENYGDAYSILYKDANQVLSYEEFYFVFAQYSVVKRLVTGTLVHELKVQPDGVTALLTLCNAEFGLSRTFTIRKPAIGIWTLDLDQEEVEELKKLAVKWYQKQSELMGDRKYALPPWWKYKKINDKVCVHSKQE